MSRISLLHPGRFSANPPRRRRVHGGVIEIIVIRLWAFAVMAAIVVTLYALGADLAVALSAVLALSAAAAQVTGAEPLTPAVSGNPAATAL
jgi:hypothetical protein